MIQFLLQTKKSSTNINKEIYMNISTYQTVAITTFLYLAPKGLTYLCTNPGLEAKERFDRLRQTLSNLQEVTKDILGKKTWFVLTNCIADNLWLSFICFRYLNCIKRPFENFEKSLDSVNALVSLSVFFCMCKIFAVTAFPSTKKYIGLRSDDSFKKKPPLDSDIPLYERLRQYLETLPLNDEFKKTDLIQCKKIPKPLHEDVIFRLFVCPITNEPIRDPVRDPTNEDLNGGTLYEKSAITDLLKTNPISPVTKQLLFPDALLPDAIVKAIVDKRLDQHREGLINYLNSAPKALIIEE